MARGLEMDSLTVEINKVLAQYTSDVNQTVDQVMKSNAQEAKKALTWSSPARSGKYAKSWAVKKQKGQYIVYNKKPGLTHLLENGHDIVRNGVKVGHAPAQVHIQPVEEMIQEKIVKELEEKL
jgi:uncharacterized protein involved in propanediol utilization